jgi:hypothetical protein
VSALDTKEDRMKVLVTVVLLGALVMGVSPSVRAATLFAPPLPGGGAGVYCQAVNVSTAPRDVTITILDANALVVNSHACPALAVLHSCTLGVPGAGTAPHFCRVDVNGTKATVRASIVRLMSDGTPAVALPAE